MLALRPELAAAGSQLAAELAAADPEALAGAVIREAQRTVIDPNKGILPGPDTDLITDRFDGCHMGRQGLMDHASAWQAVLRRARSVTRAG